MLKFFLPFILLMVSAQVWAQTKNKIKQRPKINFVADEIIVKYKSNISLTSQNQSIQKYGGKKLKRIGRKGLSHIKLPPNSDLKAALLDFKNDPDVEYVQPNYIYTANAVPNDTFYSYEWGLNNSGQTVATTGLGGPDSVSSTNNPGTSGKDMRLQTAWDVITDCSSVIVAVVDSGINYNHNDLATNMWDGGVTYPNHGYDFVGNTNDPMDKFGHGTHVAGTIGAIGNNATGTTGVCWKVQLMAVRVLDHAGSGTSASLIAGINFAVTNGAKVINLSLGGANFDQAQSDEITNAQASGVFVVAAAGNNTQNIEDPATPTYPCGFTQSNLLCVAALDQIYSLASFSNYGATSVDVGAPGTNIVSTWPGTQSTIADALTAGWNFSIPNNWGYKTLNFGGAATNTLVSPPTYDYSTVRYSNNTNDSTWKSFDLSGYISGTLNLSTMVDTEDGIDLVTLKASSVTGDPYDAGTLLAYYTGASSGQRVSRSYDITPYISATSTFGFNLITDASVTNFGVNISQFSIDLLALDNVTYNVAQGTSMATPHVAGLAAMLFAYNPNYTYTDVINSIKGGGTSVSALVGKTTTGKAANATNSLAYINPPTGGAAIKVP